jgi:hypothetical protein
MFFIAHPSIIKLMFGLFNCKQIDAGEYWLSAYLNIECWNALHYRYAMVVALPSIILWGILTPTIALILLVRFRRSLDDLNVKIRFGFLYTGYQPQQYYWEFLILYRKILIIIFAVFFTNISIPVQALCVMLVLIVSFILQMKKNPYVTPVLNDLELRGILTGTLTIYCGLFFLTSSMESDTKIGLFAVIILANAYFIVYWLIKMCKAGCELFLAWLPKVSRKLTGRANVLGQSSLHVLAPSSAVPSHNASHDMSISASKVRTRQYMDSSMEVYGVQRVVPDNSVVADFQEESSIRME